MNKAKLILAIGLAAVFAAGCANAPKWQKGAAVGGAVGAGTGAIIGHQSGHGGEGALIGGAIGAVTGGLIGAQMDKQQAELSKVAEVERPTEDTLVVTLREKVLFDTNEYMLKPGAEDNLNQIADILIRYPDTYIRVEGHTDSSGSETYNQWLSEKRAQAVADFLISRGVDPMRTQPVGYGETRPVATNETPEGRQQNRRVEIHIEPLQQ
jgi:outer membrane protein OmpA-like peptidoglycan-associated protein